MGLPGARFLAQRDTTGDARNSSIDSGEKDVALAFVGEHAQAIDPEVEKRVVRKIDLFLIPAMVIGNYALPNKDQCCELADDAVESRLWTGLLR